MRNLIIFIRRYFNFFLFLLLEVICLVFVFRHNNFQRSLYLNSANALSGSLYSRYNDVSYYFHLQSANDSLLRENARLHNELQSSFEMPDTSSRIVTDTLRRYTTDSLRLLISSTPRKFLYREAKVINNSVNREINTLTLKRGRNQGVEPNMGVIGPSGVVGVVRSVSDNYAVVVSLLYKATASGSSSFGLSARLLRTGEIGTVYWDGKDPSFVQMKDVPRSAKLNIGDTVVTSGYSAFYPEGVAVGYVVDVSILDPSSTSYHVKLRLATNFPTIEHVYIIENFRRTERERLEDSTRNLLK